MRSIYNAMYAMPLCTYLVCILVAKGKKSHDSDQPLHVHTLPRFLHIYVYRYLEVRQAR